MAQPPSVSNVRDAGPASTETIFSTGDLTGDEVPPPAYGDIYGHIEAGEGNGSTEASVTDDGRVNIRVDEKSRAVTSIASFIYPALQAQAERRAQQPSAGPHLPEDLIKTKEGRPVPPMNVVIHVVGSRGDVQPFIALGKVLQEQYGHRVRLATHEVFRQFVLDHGLEFFCIGGDPSELMQFMVKNPGLMPDFDSLRAGDVGKRRKEIATMIKGCWRSCIETGDGSGLEASDANMASVMGEPEGAMASKLQPFVADAIIANPPSFAHIHVAERLGIPLHLMFTMPWSPTQSFPHPLANIQATNTDNTITNYISYALVDMLTWQGLGDIINRFRQTALGLDPISLSWAPGMLSRLRIPCTYCWSPTLIPKPADWSSHISISGFYFLSLASNYEPDPALAAFLEAGPPPVYIGFGSIVVNDPNGMTNLIFEAVKKSGQRALVSKGWGGFGSDDLQVPEGIFMLGNVPHDWLFKHVSAVVHHGGAGTTSAGIAAGKPTVIVPFFGDQPFWGSMVARAGAGPPPIPHKTLTAENLAAAIESALEPSCIEKAKAMSQKIATEDGAGNGARSFHQQLNVDKLRCSLCPDRIAIWKIKSAPIFLSGFAAATLAARGLVEQHDLRPFRPTEWDLEGEPWEPISGVTSALVETVGAMSMGVSDLPVRALQVLGIHPDQAAKGKAKAKSTDTLDKAPSNSKSDEGDNSTDAAKTRKQSGSASSGTDAKAETQAPSAAQKGGPISEEDIDAAVGAGKGAWRITTAGLKSPMEFTMGLARGFHNAPKLYGDDTVRKPDKITGISSGLKSAGKGFALGLADGIGGLVTQPYYGAQKEGAAGFIKGVGKGIGGVVFKPSAAAFGIPAYTMRGIYKELTRAFGPSVDNYILAARSAQGYADYHNSAKADQDLLVERWIRIKRFIGSKKALATELDLMQRQFWGDTTTRASSTASLDPPAYEEQAGRYPRKPTPAPLSEKAILASHSRSSTQDETSVEDTYSKAETAAMEDEANMEAAIRQSIAETSRGNAQEDAMIESAIRTSLAEIESRKQQGATDEELQAAMQASLEEAQRGRIAGGAGGEQEEDDDLKEAMEQSLKLHEQTEADNEKARKEEDIVMQYMLRQSALEREYSPGQQPPTGESSSGGGL